MGQIGGCSGRRSPPGGEGSPHHGARGDRYEGPEPPGVSRVLAAVERECSSLQFEGRRSQESVGVACYVLLRGPPIELAEIVGGARAGMRRVDFQRRIRHTSSDHFSENNCI